MTAVVNIAAYKFVSLDSLPALRLRLLEEAGWRLGADGVRWREGQRLALNLTTFVDRPELPLIATALQEEMRQIGIAVRVVIGNSSDIPAGHRSGLLQMALAARNYGNLPEPVASLLQDFGPEGGDGGAQVFASAVQDRFNNPFINHELMSISLNSTSKWKARNMPSLLEYVKLRGGLPKCLATSFAAYVAFYSSDIQTLTDKGLVCKRPKGNEYTVSDDRWVLEFYYAHRDDSAAALVHAVMTSEKMWGQDLTLIAGFEQATVQTLELIREKGAAAAFQACL